jgi:hypothetical protein
MDFLERKSLAKTFFIKALFEKLARSMTVYAPDMAPG